MVEIDRHLLRALEARARKERTSVRKLVRRLLAGRLEELGDYEAVQAFRARPGKVVALADVKKRLRLGP